VLGRVAIGEDPVKDDSIKSLGLPRGGSAHQSADQRNFMAPVDQAIPHPLGKLHIVFGEENPQFGIPGGVQMRVGASALLNTKSPVLNEMRLKTADLAPCRFEAAFAFAVRRFKTGRRAG
jgi:hypothetical protein